MKNLILKIILLFIFSNQIISQIVLTEKDKNEYIPFVELTDSNGNIVGFSDEKGMVGQQLIEKIKKINLASINLKHMSYKPITLSLYEFLDSKNISFVSEPITLSEVIVKPNNKKLYLVIEGYYRSINIVDKHLKYYSDGRLELLYPINSNKRILTRRLQNRSFANFKLIERTKKNNLTNINVMSVPIVDMNLGLVDIKKNREIYNYQNESDINYFLKSKDTPAILRQIKTNKNLLATLQEIEYISPKDKIELSRFGWQTNFEYQNEISLFLTNTESDISLKNILYHKEVRKYKMKAGKNQPFQDVELVMEYFIDNVKFYDEKPKGFKGWGGFNDFSNYTYKYWEQVNKLPYYTSLPSGIQEAIDKNLIELKNKSK